MSKKMTGAVVRLTFVVFLCATATAQTTTGGRYEKDGLSFSYPAGWRVEDKSNAQAQHLLLTREGGFALVVLVAHRELITRPEQLAAANRNVWRPYAEDMARKLGIEKNPPWQKTQCQDVGRHSAVGVRLNGKLNGQPTTGEVYALMLGRRFVNVFFIRYDKEEALEVPAWKALLESLKVEEPADLPPLTMSGQDMVSVGLFPGGSFKKPQPEYPAQARSARAQGQVVVQVVVDEKGDVISAQAISGHRLLHDACERAARRAKFTPTFLCGRPTKVTGTITYNFVLQ